MSVGIACQAKVKNRSPFSRESEIYCDNNARGTREVDGKEKHYCNVHLKAHDRQVESSSSES